MTERPAAATGPVRVARYAPYLPAWPADLPLRVVVLSDFHVCDPWMSANRLTAICQQANALQPDIVLLLGDYLSGPRLSRPPAKDTWAAPLAGLKAPHGVHAVLGNHDYRDDAAAQALLQPTAVELALEAVGIPVYVNRAVRLERAGRGFWLAGLGDQFALPSPRRSGRGGRYGVDDLDGTLAQASGEEPVLLMAHEPDIFPEVPARVALTLSGHTHGGQVRLFGYAPVVPSRFGRRYVYGHIVEAGRHLIVTAGLGLSGWPIRFGVPPEMLLIELGTAEP